jgi:formamidopyrimidine-DNA glycosylase
MPELPEVETIARALRPELVGRTILSADLLWPRTLAAPSPAEFAQCIAGQQILSISRRAKFFILHLSSLREPQGNAFTLLIHLRMSGDLHVEEAAYAPQKHDRLLLALAPSSPLHAPHESLVTRHPSLVTRHPSLVARHPSPVARHSSLVFTDPRKFGRVWLTAQPDEVLGSLGPEPLEPDFTPQAFYARLHSRSRQLKPLLLEQSFIAGLGNIYTDEALHAARLHPLARADSVTAEQAEGLWRAVRTVLEEGIRLNGASIDQVYRGGQFQEQFRVYGRGGQPCPACGTKIERLTVGQRGTHFCPTCQPLAGDRTWNGT